MFLDRKFPDTAFKYVSPLFKKADIVFGNCEGVYSHEWERAPSSGIPLIADPKGINALAEANFTVMSLANNHAVDGGSKALIATRDKLNAVGIMTSGAGENIDLAHKPASG